MARIHEESSLAGSVPTRCLECPAFNRVLLVRWGDQDTADVTRILSSLGLQYEMVLDDGWNDIREDHFEFVLWVTQEPQAAEMQALGRLRRQCPKLPILVTARVVQADAAIELMKAGAHDFLARPVEPAQLQSVLGRALQSRRHQCEALLIPGVIDSHGAPPRLIGQSPPMLEVYKQIGLVADRRESVIIYGETGTGKELVARTIHRHSSRRDQIFLAINCAAVPETLLESELFGHEKGAFTGATQRRIGAFEKAHGGTLFLDEIGDMGLALQAKMLRVLQQGEIQRLGSHETVRVDVRVVAATHRVLEKAIQDGTFREDLYFRLNVVSLRLPPLRDHPDDILELVDYFIERYTSPGDKRVPLAQNALRKLQSYAWPGNIRELENTIRRAMVLAKGQAIMEKDIRLGDLMPPASCQTLLCAAPCIGTEQPASATENAVDVQLDAVLQKWFEERRARAAAQSGPSAFDAMHAKLVGAALVHCGGNQVQAARLLGISRSTLRDWLKKSQPEKTLSSRSSGGE